jgi:peptidyl-prolyl cis-trans isomerase B (cyclophilin B)
MSTRDERDRRLAQLRVERQQERAEARRRRQQRKVVGISLLAVLLLAGAAVLSVTRSGSPAPAAAPTPSPVTCSYFSSDTSNPLVTTRPSPPGFGTRRSGTATMLTNHGTVVFSLLANDAPCAAASFAFLAAHKYFDGTSCDRLTTGGLKFLQCGRPKRGTGPGYAFPVENVSPATRYPAGTVGLANRGPDTNGSVFFLCYGDTQLPPLFTPFGRVVSGLDVLRAVAADGARPAGDGVPNTPVTITTLRTRGT